MRYLDLLRELEIRVKDLVVTFQALQKESGSIEEEHSHQVLETTLKCVLLLKTLRSFNSGFKELIDAVIDEDEKFIKSLTKEENKENGLA